jgi:drug/metabolite transporter (DMT)-like permease
MAQKSRRDRLRGVFEILAALTMQNAAYALLTRLPPLQATAWYNLSGATALFAWVKGKKLPLRGLGWAMWFLIARVAVSNLLVGVLLLYAAQRLSYGAAITTVALGAFVYGMWTILRNLFTSWGFRKLGVRAFGAVGVVLVNELWTGTFDRPGLIAALAGALCFWNYLDVTGRMSNRKLADEGATVASIITLLGLWALMGYVWLFGDSVRSVPVLGDLLIESAGTLLPLFVIGLILVAGLAIFTVPTILQNKAAGRLAKAERGFWTMFDSPIGALIGELFATIGWIQSEHRLTLVGWIGIAIVAAASYLNTRTPEEPPKRLG